MNKDIFAVPSETDILGASKKKKPTIYSLPIELTNEFGAYCDELKMTKSSVIETLIINFLKNAKVR